jgi:hypothetical protein
MAITIALRLGARERMEIIDHIGVVRPKEDWAIYVK